ncbi:sigma-70 family RNA polymerase sigma factor [Aeoliella sp. ICT_H6.2]|uniref:Sigma-70 family RNA polymerase sigma factor n=1 Tax=Aeoliella straminimaris TaxID=2954799 RepID=A0A9X2JIQ6_9BACT|nr:sigma-70 family RNA polymerase sigma factor [Aeoliella straminimaris]MCO6044189.1 sigma-70 family RNA polymerase sigma factor [Aeoliella straminimaris]
MTDNDAEPPPSRDVFVQSLTNAQLGLLRYITALVGDPEAANNILQNTNLLLWQKADEFEPGTNFDAWATKIAYWQVKAYCRDRGRDRHVFGDTLVAQLSDRVEQMEDIDWTVGLLRKCLKKLQSKDRELIALRYDNDFSVQQLSSRLGKSPSAIKGALLRARRALRACVERQMVQEP